MIRVRDDDVLMWRRKYDADKIVRMFKEVHEWTLLSDKFIHVPAIVVEDIQNFPEGIKYIEQETKEGRMLPEIHGLQHIDYSRLNESKIQEHLIQCIEFINKKFNYEPTIWYTPWGANAQHLKWAANSLNLQMVDCSFINKMNGRHGITQRLMDGANPEFLDDHEIFMHWHDKYRRKLLQIVRSVQAGSWNNAIEQYPEDME